MRLFLYGTLLQGSCNPVAAALHRRIGPGVPARAEGRLFALPDPAGWYPALVPGGGGTVCGMVHPLPAGFDFAALDAYEDYRPDRPEGSEYRRCEIAVRAQGEGLRALAYVYGAPLPPGAVPLPQGDFRAFLAAGGHAAFG